MADAVKKQQSRPYTYADYLTWDNDCERYEIIDGNLYVMAPAPGERHQFISTKLAGKLDSRLSEKGCNVYAAPFDVRLDPHMKPVKPKKDEDIKTVVQPDISVYCDKSRVDEKGGIGPPELVVEILSPNTRDKDLSSKLLLYNKNQVKEYWIVDPENQTLMQFVLAEDGYFAEEVVYGKTDTLKAFIFEDVEIDLSAVFDF